MGQYLARDGEEVNPLRMEAQEEKLKAGEVSSF